MFGNDGMVMGLSMKVKKLESLIRKLWHSEQLEEAEIEYIEKLVGKKKQP